MKAWIGTGVAAAAIAAYSAAAAQAAGSAPRWVTFSADRDGQYAYDPASVARSGETVTVRKRFIVNDPDSPMRSAVITMEIGCSGQTTAYTRVETFDGAGTVLHAADAPRRPGDAGLIMPASPDEVLYRLLCPAALVRPIPEQPRGPPIMMVPPAPPPPILYRPAPPPPPPPPRSQRVARAAWAVPQSQLFSEDDYPAEALEAGEEGSVAARLQVSREGRVEGCIVIQSSGSASLDSTTCRLLVARARFTPARDHRGRRTTDTVPVRIVWRIPPPEPEPVEPEPGQPEQS
jgi:TonB family protein